MLFKESLIFLYIKFIHNYFFLNNSKENYNFIIITIYVIIYLQILLNHININNNIYYQNKTCLKFYNYYNFNVNFISKLNFNNLKFNK